MYLYIFGSACRGELDEFSDIDLIAIHDQQEDINHLDSNKFSIYRENKIKKLWLDGNPFAWHLYLESKLVFSSDGKDFLRGLAQPNEYTEGINDCKKFYDILQISINSIKEDKHSVIFDFSSIFLCLRNIATCYSLHKRIPIFSRDSAIFLTDYPLKIDNKVYEILKKSRFSNTRGTNLILDESDILSVINSLATIDTWAKNLIQMMKYDDI